MSREGGEEIFLATNENGYGPAMRVMDCGGKRSATPLSHARKFSEQRWILVRPKALSSLRSASAVQDGFGLRMTNYKAAAPTALKTAGQKIKKA